MSRRSLNFRQPPHLIGYTGRPRRIGVEIEFAAVSAKAAAEQVEALFGGQVIERDRYYYDVVGTQFGDFVAKLDSQYVHGDGRTAGQTPLTGFQETLRTVIGEIGSLIIPCEIVCPPIEITEFGRLEALAERLESIGAQGTTESIFYAFGAQFNPEIAENSAGYILSVLKAQALLSDWLRAVMAIDTTRQVTSFASPFPAPYRIMIVDPDYWPAMDTLIADYLRFNPTRNRELDLLPLLAWLDEAQVRATVQDPRIKPRPTFHYRLPDAKLGQPDWSLTLEWNRWCVVERLAADRDRLAYMGEAYIANSRSFFQDDWPLLASEWIAL